MTSVLVTHDLHGARAYAGRLVMLPTRCKPASSRVATSRNTSSSWQSPIRKGFHMPSKTTLDRAREDKREGKSPSTQAGEFVREEMDHIREGKHGARSPQQAIAIGLSKARRAGVELPPPKKGKTSEATRKKAEQDTAASHRTRKPSAKRSRATTNALKREGRSAASHSSLSKHAKQSAARRRRSGKVSA